MTVNFSEQEIRALKNIEFFRVKERATSHIQELFAEIRDELKKEADRLKQVFPKQVDISTGKIFKGENYLGLPYLVLDFPKYFSKELIFSFRTMFWWGNHYSFTAHFSPVPEFLTKERLAQLRGNKMYLCVNSSPWVYHYESDNYKSLDEFDDLQLEAILKKPFIKISAKFSIDEHEGLTAHCKRLLLIILRGK